MLYEVLKSKSTALLAVFFYASAAFSLPLSDQYRVTTRNFVDDSQNSPLNFDNSYSVAASTSGLTKISETIRPFDGIPAGVQVIKAGGVNANISSWSESGYVIEFTVASTDSGFISFAPYKTDWAIKLQDIDLEPLLGSTPQVLGVYFDFTNKAQELPYNLNQAYLSAAALGVGKHPFENQDVIYATSIGSEFDNFGFASISNNKLQINLDSQVQFESFSLESITKALGVSANFNQNPKVNLFKVGVLVKGILVSQYILLTGDFNCDLSVNAADYTVWRDHLGLQGNAGPCSGDADGDRDVDYDDYALWKANYGNVYQPPQGAAALSSFVSFSEDDPIVQSSGISINKFDADKIMAPDSTNKKVKKPKKKNKKKKSKIKNKKKAAWNEL